MENIQYEEENGDSPVKDTKSEQVRLTIAAIVIGIAIVAGLIFLIYFLLLDGERTSKIKDIMIIFIGFELFLIGFSTTILIIQISKLVNLFQNEIRPLVESANETIYTLKGTATFIGDSFIQPVVKLNTYMAAFKKMLNLLNFKK